MASWRVGTFFIISTLACYAHGFDCNLAPRPHYKAPEDPATPYIEAKDLIRPALEVLFGGLPGASIGLFLVEKMLTNSPNAPGIWDQVKEKVEHLVNSKIDVNRLNDLCNNLKEFRQRLSLCDHDEKQAKTSCLRALVDYMIGKEPHFQGQKPRDVALMLGTYTQYTVMTLAVGNMLIKQNREFPVEGIGALPRLKEASRRFSEYINASVPQAIGWRKLEAAHYEKFSENFFVFWPDGEGVFDHNRKRSVEYEEEEITISPENMRPVHIRPRILKRAWGGASSLKTEVKLVIKDHVTGKKIFEAKDRDVPIHIPSAYERLFGRARPTVERHRHEVGEEMRKLYEQQVLLITNQYWRIYDGNDFGDLKKEAENRKWLKNIGNP